MPALPPIVIALQAGRDPRAVLVAAADDAGRIVAGPGRWPDAALPGTLLAPWPGSFAWSDAALRFRESTVAGGGAVVPLGAVLERIGLGRPRTLDALAAALLGDRADVEPPERLAAELLGALRDRLGDDGPEGNAGRVREEAPAPAPGLAEDLAALPDAPGVYEFQSADGRALYVGKATSLRRRAAQHFRSGTPAGERLASRAVRVLHRTAGSDLEALLVEHRLIRTLGPALNTQEAVRTRGRGRLRDARLLLVIPAADPRWNAVCLVAGDGRFDWSRVRRGRTAPRDLARALREFTAGGSPGRGPLDDERLDVDEQRELAEIALTWLARHGDRVSRIDLTGETGLRPLLVRVRALLALDPRGERVEIR